MGNLPVYLETTSTSPSKISVAIGRGHSSCKILIFSNNGMGISNFGTVVFFYVLTEAKAKVILLWDATPGNLIGNVRRNVLYLCTHFQPYEWTV
jgi:hypothetical protein